MKSNNTSSMKDKHLRFLFDDAVFSFNLDADATFEDVAERLRSLPSGRYGRPLDINVTMPAAHDGSVRPASSNEVCR